MDAHGLPEHSGARRLMPPKVLPTSITSAPPTMEANSEA